MVVLLLLLVQETQTFANYKRAKNSVEFISQLQHFILSFSGSPPVVVRSLNQAMLALPFP